MSLFDAIVNMFGKKLLKEFPPRQKPASFSLDQGMEKLTQGAASL